MRAPTTAEILAVAGAIGTLGQAFGITVPEMKRADANMEANFAARDHLGECMENNARLIDAIRDQP